MFACSNSVCACRKLSTFRYHLLFCCWFLIFDINCGVCWKDKFLLKTVLNIVDSSTPRSRAGTFLYLGHGSQWNVCLPDFMFLGQTLNSEVVSTLNILYEAKLLEIKKNEIKLPLLCLTWLECWHAAVDLLDNCMRRMLSPLLWGLLSSTKKVEGRFFCPTSVWSLMIYLWSFVLRALSEQLFLCLFVLGLFVIL